MAVESTNGKGTVLGSEEKPENVPIKEVAKSTERDETNESLSFLKEHTNLLQEIKGMIQKRLEYDDVKEKAFDKLYEEMRRQKESLDLLDRVQKPLLSDLLLLYDNMKSYEKSLNNEDIFNNFKYILDELLEILYRQEVVPIEQNLSETFNSKFHKATKIENAESKDEDFKIINIVRNGFLWRERVLRPHEVVIKRFISKE